MTFAEFKNKYLGRLIDYDGWYGAQCFDVANQYILDITGKKPLITLLKASDIYKRPQGIIPAGVEYDKIANTIDFVPKQGDIIVWDDRNWNLNYGHVAIVDTATKDGATVIQQDGLNPRQGVRSVYWNFHTHNFLGVLRLKTINQTNNQDMFKQEIINNLKKTKYFYPDRERVFTNGNAAYFAQEYEMAWQSNETLTNDLAAARVEINNLKTQNAIIHREDKPETLAQLDQLTLANAELTKQMQQLAEENKALNEELNKKLKPSLNEEIKNEVYPQFTPFLNFVKNNISMIAPMLAGYGIVIQQDMLIQIVYSIMNAISLCVSYYLQHTKDKNK